MHRSAWKPRCANFALTGFWQIHRGFITTCLNERARTSAGAHHIYSPTPALLYSPECVEGLCSEVCSQLGFVSLVATLGGRSSCRVGVVTQGTRKQGEEAPNGATG
jgi:hypothetical protein